MFSYQDKIKLLRAVGQSLIKEDTLSEDETIDNEIETIRQEVEMKRGILQVLDEKMDAYEDYLYECNGISDQQKEEIRHMKQRVDVLQTYMKVLTSDPKSPESDEFPIYRLKKELDDYIQGYWLKCKAYSERSKGIQRELEELRSLRDRYLELKQRADNSMI